MGVTTLAYWADALQQICPSGASTLPMMGKHVAPVGQAACPILTQIGRVKYALNQFRQQVNSLKRIGAEAFYHNERLLYIKFLSNVSVGDCAFACCPIIRIKKPDDMVFGDKVFVQDTSYDKFAFWD